MVRLQHLQRLVQPKLHVFLERTVCFGLDGGNGVCQVHIAGIYLPGGQKLLLGPVDDQGMPVALSQVIMDGVTVVAYVLLPLEHFHGGLIIPLRIQRKALQRGYGDIFRILGKKGFGHRYRPVIIPFAQKDTHGLGERGLVPGLQGQGTAIIPQGRIGLPHLVEPVAYIAYHGRDGIPLQHRQTGLDTLGKSFHPIVNLHEPDLIEDILRLTGRKHEIRSCRAFQVSALEMAVGQFGKDAFVHGARQDKGRKQLYSLIYAVYAFQVPRLGQHGIAVGGLRPQRHADHHPQQEESYPFHYLS